MIEILSIISGRIIFNFVGAFVRWGWGSIWDTLRKKKKYSFQEYLNGPKYSRDWFDKTGHGFVNRIIGIISITIVLIFVMAIISKNKII